MSFSKNDTFPTLSLVPIVLAAGTVYIGRRYFATLLLSRGSSDTTSNAVTRRRRFAKNSSFPRRPIQIGNFQTTCNTITSEETMPTTNNRRITRNKVSSSISSSPVPVIPTDAHRYSPLTTNNNGFNTTNGATNDVYPPIAPKHIPFPNTPVDHQLYFEFVMFLFTICAAGLQFVHLYRSVWWLPHSYTNNTLNFYLIDVHLVIFIGTVLSRRFIYSLLWYLLQYFTNPKLLPLCKKLLKFVTLSTVFTILVWCTYKIVQNHPIVNIFYLCYPISVYVILFGINVSPFLELITPTDVLYLDGNPLHSCTSNAAAVRTEVEFLKTDFNMRMKQILFNSVLHAYYVGFVPCCFAQSFLYYDVYWATQHLVFVWLGCFTMIAVHVIPARYCDVLHRTALHLGAWIRADSVSSNSNSPRGCMSSNATNSAPIPWSPDVLYPPGIIVRHSRENYRSMNICNAAEPNNIMHSRFYTMFYNPSIALCGILGLQLCLVFVQLILLFRSTIWYQIVSLTLLLFANYYTLFKLARDYLISWKMYKNLKRSYM